MNLIKKSWEKEENIILIAATLSLILSQSMYAADPGHGASVIGSGTFESGNHKILGGNNER